MSTPKGYAFMTLLAVYPPAVVIIGYVAGWPASNLSVTIKTLLGLIYGLVLYRAVIPFYTSPLRHLPSPRDDNVVLGQGLSVFDRPPGRRLLRWMKEVPNDGLIAFRGFFHLRQTLLPTTPEAVMDVLNTRPYDYEKPAPARRFLARVLGNGLINVEGAEHKLQRKAVTPAFTGKNIKELVPLFWEKSHLLADAVERESAPTSGHIEISQLASKVTLDIIGVAGLGKDFGALENADHDLAKQYETITGTNKGSMALYFAINLTLPQPLVRKLPLKIIATVANAAKNLRTITKDLLVEKHASMQEKTVEQKDIIALLMRSEKFNDDGLTDQLLTFLAAGHETTASALSWALYLIAKHPHIQSRLRTECQQVCGNVSRTDGNADLIDSLPLLEAACNETLRLYPTVPVTAREAVKDTTILSHFIPKGTVALISPWAINRNPFIWGDDSEEFKPDRWMGPQGKNGGAASASAFITFLHGPRSCIGQGFARYELKCLLAVLIHRFHVELKNPNEVPVPAGAITIKPRDGMHLIMTRLAG